MPFTFNPFSGNFDNTPSTKDAKSVYTSVKNTSANWDSVYTTYNENSATYATIEFANNKFLPLSGGTITGNLYVLSSVEIGLNNSTTTFYVDDQKVGINTETPNVELTVNGSISSNNTIFDRNGNSEEWNSVYTTYNENSATYATQNYVQNNFLALTGGTVTGDTQFNKNVTIWGVLSATGGTYFANTIYSTTSALSVIHVGSGTALYVGSTGTGDIASFYDLDDNVEMLHIGGHDGDYPNVGIKTSTPNVDFTVNGEISSSKIIYDANGNSTNWNSVYTTVQTKSATEWDNSIVQSYANNAFLPLSGGTMSGKLIVAANESTSKLNIGNAISLPEPSFLVNGDIWLTSGNRIGWRSGGVTYASAITNLSNTFNQPQIINLTSNVSPALRITQNGSANAIVVEDSTNPDATSFIIDNVGSVGIGLSSLSGVDSKLTIIGNVSSTGVIYASGGNSDLWNSVYTTVNSNSPEWDSVYTTVQEKSATEWNNTLVNQYTHSNFLPLSGGTMTGKLFALYSSTEAGLNIGLSSSPVNSVNGDIWLNSAGRLSIKSNSQVYTIPLINSPNSFTSTQTINVSGNSVAMRITQQGNGEALRVEDETTPDTTAFIVGSNGSVGIGLSSLSGIDSKLTVVGNISATGIVYANNGNSDLWNSVYTSVNPVSSNWNSVYTSVKDTSGNWNSVYTTYNKNSATYATIEFANNKFLPLSGGIITGDLTVDNILQIGDGNPNFDFIITEEGNVGINTETPNVELTVVGNISCTGFLYGDGSNLTGIIAGDTVATTLVRTNSANWDSVYSNVQTNSASYATISFANTKFLPLTGGTVSGNISAVGNHVFEANSTSEALRITQTGSGNAIVVEDSTNPDSTPFVVTQNGQVIIGSLSAWSTAGLQIISEYTSETNAAIHIKRNSDDSSPCALRLYKGRGTYSVPLDVLAEDQIGNIAFHALLSNDTQISTQQRGANIRAFVDGNPIPSLTSVPTRFSFWTTTSGANVSTEKMRITHDGKVGIGTTSPNEKLTVVGNISAVGNHVFESESSTATVRITQKTGGVGDALVVEDSNNPDTSSFVVKGDGRVGIGTLSPISKLNIVEDNENAFRISNNETHEYYASFGCTLSAGYFTAGSALVRDVPLVFRTSLAGAETEKVRFAADGKVGIGTTTPNETLTVVGNISATQNYFSGSNKSVFTPQTNTVGVSAISNIVAVSVLPATPDPSTLYIIV